MKQVIAWFLVFMILFSSASLLRDPGQQEWENPYIDVTQDMWSYQYITELNKAGVLPSGDNFHGQEEETRGNLVLYLYKMDNGAFADRKKQREKEQGKPQADPASFSDVAEWYHRYGVLPGPLPDPGAGVHHSDPVCCPGGDLPDPGGGAGAVQRLPGDFQLCPQRGHRLPDGRGGQGV